jgi:glycerol uptake facilitator-like aquaporin
MWQETFGTMVFVIFFKLCTDETLYFSKEQAINCLIIAASYIASRDFFGGGYTYQKVVLPYPLTKGVTNYGACLNPAIALGIFLTSLFFQPG